MGSILALLGLLVLIAGGIWLLIVAFQKSVVWGLCCLLIPFVSLIFVFMNWDKAGKPFLVQVAGAILLFGGNYLKAS